MQAKCGQKFVYIYRNTALKHKHKTYMHMYVEVRNS